MTNWPSASSVEPAPGTSRKRTRSPRSGSAARGCRPGCARGRTSSGTGGAGANRGAWCSSTTTKRFCVRSSWRAVRRTAGCRAAARRRSRSARSSAASWPGGAVLDSSFRTDASAATQKTLRRSRRRLCSCGHPGRRARWRACAVARSTQIAVSSSAAPRPVPRGRGERGGDQGRDDDDQHLEQRRKTRLRSRPDGARRLRRLVVRGWSIEPKVATAALAAEPPYPTESAAVSRRRCRGCPMDELDVLPEDAAGVDRASSGPSDVRRCPRRPSRPTGCGRPRRW